MLGNKGDFVGHIGGDDFVFVTTPDKEEEIALGIIKEFDRLIPYHYSEQDRANGFIESKDREGHLSKIPLMNISIALINNENAQIDSLVQLSEIASQIKSHLKTISGSKFLQNRRVEDKGKHTRTKQISKIRKRIELASKTGSEKPLGQLLLEADLVNKDALDEALIRHWRSGQQLGRVLVSMGIVKEEDVFNMLKAQGVI
jgi:GGDEF domain-containing protein